jgi:hypothetical protein
MEEIVFVPSLTVKDANLFYSPVSVTHNIAKFNFTSEDIKLKYQARADTWAKISPVLSYILIVTSAILYLMGHDSIGMALSAQLVYLLFAGIPPVTVDLISWGRGGHPAVFGLFSGDTVLGRWAAAPSLLCSGLYSWKLFQVF